MRRAIAINPNLAEAYNILGNLLKDTGHLEEAIAAFRRAIAIKPGFGVAHSNLLFNLHYAAEIEPAEIAAEHFRWDRQHSQPLREARQIERESHPNSRDPGRRLRIGYVSPDFRDHAVARFLLPLLANHDHEAVEIFAYANVRVADEMTQQLSRFTDAWRNVVRLSDAQAADQIREDRIDILVDLAGHTGDNRLLIFARKPAPIQATYLGYPDTTGLAAIDYRLTDAFADPRGMTEPYHSEQLVRLSPCAWCFGPPKDVPEPDRPRRAKRPITFGCFNTFAKITRPMLEIWSRILLAVPESRLLLKSGGLGSANLHREVRCRLAELGIAPDRVELRPKEPDYSAHLGLYGQMDIALDTFPYHGTTTTCEALWMSVPVISLAGQTHVSRVGVSLLNNVGLPELVARDPGEYVKLAVKLAKDIATLDELHSTLRGRMEGSPLADGPRFARSIELAYRQMWHDWCRQMPPSRP